MVRFVVYKNDILWGNDNVGYKGEMLYYTKWISAGIIYLHDILIDNRFGNLWPIYQVPFRSYWRKGQRSIFWLYRG